MSLKDEEIFVDCSIIKEEYSLSQPELTIETTSANSFESTETTHFVIKEVIKEEEKKTTNFQCNICLIYFITKQCLVRHYEWAHAKDPIPCNICKRTLKNYRTLCKHLKVHDKMRIRYKCDQCEKTLATKYRLKCHIGIVHNKTPSGNSTQSAKFVIKEVKENKTTSKKFHCNVCLKYFSNKKGFTRHQFSHIIEPKPCTICQKILKNSRSLQRHMKIHDKKRKKYKCLRCSLSFSNRYTINRHISAIHDRPKDEIKKKFTCEECGKQYSGKSDFQRHVLIHSEEIDIKCPECPKKFKQQKHLDIHMDFHRKVKPFMCDICGIPFKTAGLLTKHVARHLDKSIVCPHCKNIYKNRLSFKDHMRDLHKGLPIDISVRPLYCTICKERFDDLDRLRDHVKIHNYTGAFECGHCGKLFRRKNNLKTHLLKVHTKVRKRQKREWKEPSVPLEPVSAPNEFKFACPHCDKKCFTRPYYLFHLSLHSNEQSFECEFCKTKFKSEKYLKQHLSENSCKKDKIVKSEQQHAEFPVNPATIKIEIEDSECLESQIEISEYIKVEEDVTVKTEQVLG